MCFSSLGYSCRNNTNKIKKLTMPKNKSSLNIKKIRSDFPILKQLIGKKQLIYLDNASTSQKPKSVLEAIQEYYSEYNANIHRSLYAFGEKATNTFEETRIKVAKFIKAPDEHSIIFTKGTTESINLVAYAWGRKFLKPGDEILITEMEHHSNNVPWQLCAQATGALLKYIPLTKKGTLNLKNPQKYFNTQTKIVSVIHQSNVLGTINPLEEIIKEAQKVDALTFIDAAQSAPHLALDVQKLNCDFLAFSGHKMLGPTGVGVLYGKKEILEIMDPFLSGGEMIKTVTKQQVTFNDLPWKFEGGTSNIAQVIGLGAALDYLNKIGLDNIYKYEQELTTYALKEMKKIPELTIYGSPPQRGGVISFNLTGVHPHDLAQIVNEEGIALRAGHHCAQPLMKKLNVAATARISFYFYNTKAEIDLLIKSLKKVIKFIN